MSSADQRKEWDFFISHAHSDTPVAEQLYSMLEAYGTVFLDTRSLSLGDDWDEALKEALNHSKVIVLLVPSTATVEYYVRDEISLALSLAREDPDGIRIVPVYTGTPPRGDVPYGLKALNSFSIPETGIENVAQRVRQLFRDLKAQESRIQNAKMLWWHESNLRKQPLNRPASVFISYAHRDQRLADELHRHLAPLKRDGLLTVWHDREIGAGENWKGAIDGWLMHADVILLLISPDFLSSQYCYDVEMKAALERHSRGEADVVPIILRSCDWISSPFAKLQALPRDGRPIARQDDREKAWEETVQELVNVVQG